MTTTPTTSDDATAVGGKEKAGRPRRPWFSGFCGPGPCRDEKTLDANGNPRHYCRGETENGYKVEPRYLFCACVCHRENPNAVQTEQPAA